MIVGVDVSSRRIDLAWLENGQPQRWHQELAKGHLIDRLRSIRTQWPRLGPTFNPHGINKGWDTTEIAIEMPFGRSRASISALMATVGVVTVQAPPWARVAWPSSGELRAAIGAANNKTDAHRAITRLYGRRAMCIDGVDTILQPGIAGWDEHELDALTTCIGWTRILEQQDA